MAGRRQLGTESGPVTLRRSSREDRRIWSQLSSKALADVDPNLTILKMMSFGEQVARNFNQERLIARLTELFGALALILACVGLYGVTAYAVARRTNEIRIRMALGADRRNVLGLVLRAALAQLGLGLAMGIPAALAGGHLLAHQLYGEL